MQTTTKPREVTIEGNQIKANQLLGDKTELTIVHKEEQYKLRLTKNDKLILTK